MILLGVLRVLLIGLAGFASVTSAQDDAAEYAQPGNVDTGVLADIGNWINTH